MTLIELKAESMDQWGHYKQFQQIFNLKNDSNFDQQLIIILLFFP